MQMPTCCSLLRHARLAARGLVAAHALAAAYALLDVAFVLSFLPVLSSLLVLLTLRPHLFYGDFSRTGAPALYTHAL